MEPIQVIRTRADLDGTAYFEFQPGRYSGDHWVDGSLYVQEEVFCLLEPTIRRHHPRFDHYDFATIGTHTWRAIIQDLVDLAQVARSASSLADLRRAGVGFHRAGVQVEFEQDFRHNAEALARMARDLTEWLRTTLERHEHVSVLGM